MENLCEFERFKEALQEAINLLTEENLKKRGIEKVPSNVENLKEFLTKISQNVEIKNYNQLIEFVNSSQDLKKYKEFMGFLGKILDAIQLLKPSKRSEFAINKIEQNLKRTGHLFLLNEIPENLKKNYVKELIEASATFILLEVAYTLDFQGKNNPLSTLRRSMGDRLPEEYFSELISGWIAEDVIIRKLEEKGIEVERQSVDKNRIIQFIKPKNKKTEDKDEKKMGSFDIKAYGRFGYYLFEVQRVGNKIKKKQKSSKSEEGSTSEEFTIDLKKHKYEGGNSNNKIILLWFGKDIPNMNKRDKSLENKLIFIKNIKNNSDFSFEKDKITFTKEALSKRGVDWEKFQKMSKDDFINFIEKLN